MSRLRVYCASPFHRAAMWEEGRVLPPTLEIVSTWHKFEGGEHAVTPEEFRQHWLTDMREIKQAQLLIAYAEQRDKPQGTFVEIGAALGRAIPIYLVGNYPWSNWSHHPLVFQFLTFREAFEKLHNVLGAAVYDSTQN